MGVPESERRPESKTEAEALIPLFQFERVLNQDQNGRRISLLGSIKSQPALFTLERAAFPSDPVLVTDFITGLSNTTNLGANDVYRWYMSNHIPSFLTNTSSIKPEPADTSAKISAPDLKLNLIYPCTPQHVKKYTSQPLRYVTESAAVYREHIKPWIERTQRAPARLDWIYNILDGITEQEDVIFRTSPEFGDRFTISPQHQLQIGDSTGVDAHTGKRGFMLLPDLNWDRKTVTGLHLLALVERRDLWSLRGLKKSDAPWLRAVRDLAVREAAKFGQKLIGGHDGDEHGNAGASILEEDMLKCYVHYQPTYYHFHIHIVHVMLEAEGTTQSVGKAFALENLISQLEHMSDSSKSTSSSEPNVSTTHGTAEKENSNEAGLDQIDISYFVGEASDLWQKCFSKIKHNESVSLNQ